MGAHGGVLFTGSVSSGGFAMKYTDKPTRRQHRRLACMLKSKVGVKLIQVWEDKRRAMAESKPHPRQLKLMRLAKSIYSAKSSELTFSMGANLK